MTMDFYEKLLNSLLNQVAVIDRNLNIIYQNQAFEAFISLIQRETIDDLGVGAEQVLSGELNPIYSSLKECFNDGSVVQEVLILDYMGNDSYFRYVLIPNYTRSRIESCILILYNNTSIELKKKELNHQVQFFSKLIHRLPIGVYMFDVYNSEVQMTLWNPMMKTYFGKSEEDVLGQNFESVFDKKTARSHKESIESIESTGLYYDLPSESIQTRNGKEYFHIILAPILEENTTGKSYIGIIENVSNKILQDRKLKEYQRELKIALQAKSRQLDDTTAEISSILDNSYGISIFSLDRDLKYRVFNSHHRFHIMTEFSVDIEKGMSIDNFLSILPDHGLEVSGFLSKALKGNHTSTEIFYDRKDRDRTYLDAVISPLYSQDEVIGVTVILIDTTQRRHLEREAEIFKRVADNAEYGVLLTDTDFNVTYMNGYWEDIFSRGRRESTEQNIRDFLTPSQMDQIVEAIDSIRNSGITQQIELDLISTKEDPVTILMNCVLFNEVDGEDEGIAFTCIDISPMKQAREALILARNHAERSSLLKSSFVANMSHEIRTPLNAILGFADLLEGKAENREVKNYVRSIQSSGFILKDLINDILDFSKIEAGKMTFLPEKNRIGKFLEDIFEMFRLQTSRKNLYFEIKSVNSIPETLNFDPTRVRQILLNLLGNAVKFTKWGYIKLLLNYDAARNTLIFTVSDTGIGIDARSRREIFNPFVQQEKQDARHYEGTGLGLAITNKLVSLMEGKIHLISAPGKGSQFTLEIPMQKDPDSGMTDLSMVEDVYTGYGQSECYAEEDLLSSELLELSSGSIRFTAIQDDADPKATIQKPVPCILTKSPERYRDFPGALLIEVIQEDRFHELETTDGRICILEDLKASKKLSIIKSILISNSNRILEGSINLENLRDEEVDEIRNSIRTKDFTDIESVLPLIRKCGDQGDLLAGELRNALDSFDIPALNKKMETIELVLNRRR